MSGYRQNLEGTVSPAAAPVATPAPAPVATPTPQLTVRPTTLDYKKVLL